MATADLCCYSAAPSPAVCTLHIHLFNLQLMGGHPGGLQLPAALTNVTMKSLAWALGELCNISLDSIQNC